MYLKNNKTGKVYDVYEYLIFDVTDNKAALKLNYWGVEDVTGVTFSKDICELVQKTTLIGKDNYIKILDMLQESFDDILEVCYEHNKEDIKEQFKKFNIL